VTLAYARKEKRRKKKEVRRYEYEEKQKVTTFIIYTLYFIL
jgi:hypothetical protein